MNLSVYKLRDIQRFIALASQFESEGVTDVRFIRQRLSDHLHQKAGPVARAKLIRSSSKSAIKPEPDYGECPDCSQPLWEVNTDADEDLTIVGCWKCRFSKVL